MLKILSAADQEVEPAAATRDYDIESAVFAPGAKEGGRFGPL